MLHRLRLAAGSSGIDDLIRYELRLGVSLTRFEMLLGHGGLPDGCYRLVIALIMNLLGVRELSDGEIRRLITTRVSLATSCRSIGEYQAARRAGRVDGSRGAVMCLDGDLLHLRSTLYVIGPPGGGVVKIGRSMDVASRLQALQGASPQPLTVLYAAPGAGSAETAVHAHFAGRHVRGEWFDFTGADPGPAVHDGLLAAEGLGGLAVFGQALDDAAADPAGHSAQARTMIRAALQAGAARQHAPAPAAGLDPSAKKELLARLSEPDPRTAAIARLRDQPLSPAARAAAAAYRAGVPPDGAGLARALLGIRDPAARDAVIAAWHARRMASQSARSRGR
jgi:hypothetical protein